jgi:hypothetical protein
METELAGDAKTQLQDAQDGRVDRDILAPSTLAPAMAKLPERTAQQQRIGSALEFISWFFRGDAREKIRAVAGDLRKDVRDMREQHCGRWHIHAVRFWVTTTTVLPIVWDGCTSFSKKLPILGAWIRAVSALLRRIDPPRFG